MTINERCHIVHPEYRNQDNRPAAVVEVATAGGWTAACSRHAPELLRAVRARAEKEGRLNDYVVLYTFDIDQAVTP